jgi:glycosyltransferase involved in cell wall biosynthesis
MPAVHTPRLLLISASDYQSAVIKGVVSMLADFDEGGFFERVLIAFPFARMTTMVKVSDRVSVHDIGTDWLPFGHRLRRVRRLAAPLHVLRTLAVLVGYVRREGVNVIRATDPCFSGLIAWGTSRLTGRPFCVSIHADLDQRHRLGGVSAGTTLFGSRQMARSIERFVIRRADMVMPIRESLRPYALLLGARPERVRVIPHGTDLRDFVAPAALDVALHFGIAPGTKIVSFAGRVVRENYVDDVLELARRLGAAREDFVILIAGGGLDEPRINALVQGDPVLRTFVRLVGFMPRPIVAALRQASAVSLCLMGGFSLIEACAAASPVVSYDVEWHRELVRDGETGFLVPEHDIDRLTVVVSRLLDDPALAAALGLAAQALALSRHDLETTTAIKRRCYSEIIAADTDVSISAG